MLLWLRTRLGSPRHGNRLLPECSWRSNKCSNTAAPKRTSTHGCRVPLCRSPRLDHRIHPGAIDRRQGTSVNQSSPPTSDWSKTGARSTDFSCRVRRRRSCQMRSAATPPASNNPAIAASNRAMPSGMDSVNVKYDTLTVLVFWRMNTSSSMSTKAPAMMPTQAAEIRVGESARVSCRLVCL
jgi:hypothetical protein